VNWCICRHNCVIQTINGKRGCWFHTRQQHFIWWFKFSLSLTKQNLEVSKTSVNFTAKLYIALLSSVYFIILMNAVSERSQNQMKFFAQLCFCNLEQLLQHADKIQTGDYWLLRRSVVDICQCFREVYSLLENKAFQVLCHFIRVNRKFFSYSFPCFCRCAHFIQPTFLPFLMCYKFSYHKCPTKLQADKVWTFFIQNITSSRLKL
jgi:hypothetical protein